MSHDLLLRACRRERVERTPIWIMRQAGRYLPEYRRVRERVDFLTLCRTPELAAEVTLQPIARFAFDAAIVFSDILVPADCLGLGVTFSPGPVVDRPVRSAADVERLRDDEPEERVAFVFETIRIVRHELAGRTPVIGFAAAPFTLAAYLIEGGGSRGFEHARRLLHAEPRTAHRLLERVTQVTERYVLAQVRAGAQAIQLFDTWAGLLDRPTYHEFALRYARRVLDRLAAAGVPRIYFALDASHLASEIRTLDTEVLGVDWRVGLDEAAQALGAGFALQGNLDPAVLLATPEAVTRRARAIVQQGERLPGHVFNLGHGILPETPLANVEALVRAVREPPDGRG